MSKEKSLEQIIKEQKQIRNHFINYGRYLERNGLEDNFFNEEDYNKEVSNREILQDIIDQAIHGCGLIYENIKTKEVEIYDDTDKVSLIDNILNLNEKSIVINEFDNFDSNTLLINQIVKIGIL